MQLIFRPLFQFQCVHNRDESLSAYLTSVFYFVLRGGTAGDETNLSRLSNPLSSFGTIEWFMLFGSCQSDVQSMSSCSTIHLTPLSRARNQRFVRVSFNARGLITLYSVMNWDRVVIPSPISLVIVLYCPSNRLQAGSYLFEYFGFNTSERLSALNRKRPHWSWVIESRM